MVRTQPVYKKEYVEGVHPQHLEPKTVTPSSFPFVPSSCSNRTLRWLWGRPLAAAVKLLQQRFEWHANAASL